MRSGTRRRAPAVLAVLTVLAGTAGCGFMRALADPQAGAAPSRTSSPQAVQPTPTEPGPRLVVSGRLDHRGGGAGPNISVTVGELRSGLVPPVPNFSDSCPVEPTALQYVAVDFDGGPDFAARVQVERGPDTPADAGDVGIVVESGNGIERYCFDYPPLPTADRFYNQEGAASVTGYVVLDAAITPETTAGRPEVFPTVWLRISDMRMLSGPAHGATPTPATLAPGALIPGALTIGAPCADDADADAICVPLG